jgi:hypothetical protein
MVGPCGLEPQTSTVSKKMTLAAHLYCVMQQNSETVSIYFYCFEARRFNLDREVLVKRGRQVGSVAFDRVRIFLDSKDRSAGMLRAPVS